MGVILNEMQLIGHIGLIVNNLKIISKACFHEADSNASVRRLQSVYSSISKRGMVSTREECNPPKVALLNYLLYFSVNKRLL